MNLVTRDAATQWHLSRRATYTLYSANLAELEETGRTVIPASESYTGDELVFTRCLKGEEL